MPRFPKINDKFYKVGHKQPTLRAAIETMTRIGEEFEKSENPQAPHRPDYAALESNMFSVMVGFADGVIARIR